MSNLPAVSPEGEDYPEPEYEDQPVSIARSLWEIIPKQLRDSEFRFVTLRRKGQTPEDDGKIPSMKWKDKQLMVNSPKLREQIEKVGTYAVATGHGGLVVVDVDHEDGVKLVGNLPETFTVSSGNRKLPHLYFRVVDGEKVQSFSAKRPLPSEEIEEWAQKVVEKGTGCLNDLNLETLFDFQASGKLVVGPGSRFDASAVYTVTKNVPIYRITKRELLELLDLVGISTDAQKERIVTRAKELSVEFKESCESSPATAESPEEAPWESAVWKKIEAAVKVSDVYKYFVVPMEPSRSKRFACLLGHPSATKADVQCEDDRIWYCHNCKERGSAWQLFHKALGERGERGRSNWFRNSKKFAALAGDKLRDQWNDYLTERSARLGNRANMPSYARKLYALNDRYFLAFHNGKMRVLEEHLDAKGNFELLSLSDKDFKLRHGNRMIQPPWCDSPVPIGAYWLRWKHRRTYDSVVFYPGQLDANQLAAFYNLWKGFEVKGVPGSFPKIEYHLKQIWCRGNEEHYRYLITWFAHLIQYPQEKPGVALVIKGGKGTGKSTIFEGIFERILGRMYSKIDKGSQVTGKFNAHQRAKLLLVLEEAIWAGDKQAEGALKSMITEKRTMYEPKGVDAFEEDSYVRLAFVSNEKRAVPASADERRFFSLHVSDEKKNDHAYFAALRNEIDTGGVEAFMHYLETFTFDRKDVMTPPLTSALFEDIYEGFSVFEKWAYELLHLEDTNEHSGIRWNGKVPTADLYEHYLNWIEETGKAHGYLGYNGITSQKKLVLEFNKLFGFARTKIDTRNGFYFPLRDEARRIFASKVNAHVVWNDVTFPSGKNPLEEMALNQ